MGRTKHSSLRWGYSTGACAAALAVACWQSLRTGTPPAVVPVLFGDGRERLLPLRPPAPGRMAEMVKDGGDDPDCTHGAVLFARLAAIALTWGRPCSSCAPWKVSASVPGKGWTARPANGPLPAVPGACWPKTWPAPQEA